MSDIMYAGENEIIRECQKMIFVIKVLLLEQTCSILTITHWLCVPLRILASFKPHAHASLLFAFCLHIFPFSSHKSCSMYSSHLCLGLPTFWILAVAMLYFPNSNFNWFNASDLNKLTTFQAARCSLQSS
jgi:hypothetical protein